MIVPGFCADETDWCIPALRDLAVTLTPRVELEIVSLRYPHHTEPYQAFGARVIPFGGAGTRGAARLRLLRRASRYVRGGLRAGTIDVVHALWAHEPGLVATHAAGAPGPSVVSLFGGELADLPLIAYGGQTTAFNRWAIARSLRRARVVTVPSAWLREKAAEVGWQTDRWETVPLGIDLRRFSHELPDLPPRGRVLFVGSLIPVKDPQLAIDALAALRGRLPGASLDVVGHGPLRPALEARVERLGLGGSIRLHGAVEHDALPALYRRASALLVTSWFESQSVVAVEAAASRCAIVGTEVGVVPAIDGARIVNERDPAAMAAALAEVLGEPDRLQEARARAHAWATATGDVTMTADTLVDLYHRATRT